MSPHLVSNLTEDKQEQERKSLGLIYHIPSTAVWVQDTVSTKGNVKKSNRLSNSEQICSSKGVLQTGSISELREETLPF